MPHPVERSAAGAIAGSFSSLADADLAQQAAGLEHVVSRNPCAAAILDSAGELGLPGWYLGAGCVANSVWNAAHGFDPAHGVNDYDLVYFDDHDLSAAAERSAEAAALRLFAHLGVQLDVTNEARVHLWYEQRFGRTLEPYRSSEHAISTWPTTATSVGVRPGPKGLTVCAPFGLRDLFALVVRPNRTIVTRQVYEQKVERWSALWPRLTIVGWD